MQQKEVLVVGAALASLVVVPFFFTDAFYDNFFGHGKTLADCSGFERCVQQCVETGPSEHYCAYETCAADALYGPDMVHECRDKVASK